MKKVFFLISALFISACGGGGGGGSSSDSTVSTMESTTVSGSVVDGPIAGASCKAYEVGQSGKGAEVGGPVSTDTNGGYTMTMAYSGPVTIECSGGSFTDWATGSTVTLDPSDTLTVVVSNASGTMTINVTPLTYMAANLALETISTGTSASTAIADANSAIGSHFGISDIVSTSPIDPTVTGSASGASQAAVDYAMILGGIAQYAKDNGITNPYDLVNALASDARDGSFNGMDGTTQLTVTTTGESSINLSFTAATSGLGSAITTFDQTKDASGGSVTSTIIADLNTSTGTIGSGGTTTSSIIGSWLLGAVGSGEEVVVTFLDSTHYIMAHNGIADSMSFKN